MSFLLVCFLQIIVIIKHILEKKLGRKDCFQMSGMDAMILSFVRSVPDQYSCRHVATFLSWNKNVLICLAQVSLDALKIMKMALTVPNYQNQDWNDQKFSSKSIMLIYNYYTYMYVELFSFSNSFLKGPITCKTATPEGSSCMSLTRYRVDLFFRYARNLPVSRQSLQIKCKLCQLIDVVRILTMSEIIMCKLI